MQEVLKDEGLKKAPPLSLALSYLDALEAARQDFEQIKRTRTVTTGTFSYSYAPLEDIIHAVQPALSAHGFSIVQGVVDGMMRTELRHTSGAILEASVPLVVPDGAKPQAVGSALTYARRYGLSCVLCLAADEDDDANQAEAAAQERPPSRQVPDPRIPPTDAGDAPDCKTCGKVMGYRTGVKNGRPWRAWMCPHGKPGLPGHNPVWIRDEPQMADDLDDPEAYEEVPLE